jgi:putative tryptophan/tyrosine transport system substrate-binding protein
VEPLKVLASRNGINVIDVVVHSDQNPQPEFTAAMPLALQRMAATDPELQSSIFWATGTTAVINSIELISQLAGKLPVVSVYPDLVQEGDASAVLSVGIAYENVGYLDTVYLLDILYQGRRPGDLKVGVISPPDLAISFLKARQIGVKIPFGFFEDSGYVYDHLGKAVRKNGQVVVV